MTLNLLRLAAIVLVALAAVVAVRLLDRKRRYEPTTDYGIPPALEEADFPELGGVPAAVVFTDPDCRACDGARRMLSARPVRLIEVDAASRQDLLDKYSIDGVPTSLIVDGDGAVIDGWVGPLEASRVDLAISKVS